MERLIFDTHAHYHDDKFNDFRDILIKELLGSSVEKIIEVGTDLCDSAVCQKMSQIYPEVYAAVGIHPHECGNIKDADSAEAVLRQMLRDGKTVALGEIGLDYHYDFSDRETQKEWFERQMIIAEETEIPVIVHDREAHGDCLAAAIRHPKVRGVFHSYSGSAEMAEELVRRGWYISFSGSVTFKNASKLLEAVKAVPDERLLVETDAPYLTPVPHRGKLNHSGYIVHTAEKLAEIRGTTAEEILRLTNKNACELFGI